MDDRVEIQRQLGANKRATRRPGWGLALDLISPHTLLLLLLTPSPRPHSSPPWLEVDPGPYISQHPPPGGGRPFTLHLPHGPIPPRPGWGLALDLTSPHTLLREGGDPLPHSFPTAPFLPTLAEG